MNQLVFIDNGKPATDSLVVAEAFNKEHARVMRDIRELPCSQEFRLGNYAESSYTNDQNRAMPRIIMTEQGFTLLAMGYTGTQAMMFKEKYIAEFERLKQQVQPVNIGELSPIFQLMIQTEQRQKAIEQRQDNTDRQLAIVKETFLTRDEDWRSKMKGLLNGATVRRGMTYRDMRTLSYRTLEQRAHCDLNRRLTNLKNRLRESGATKTKVEEANRMDIIESDPRLKEIYTTVVKELSIGTMS